MDTYVPLIIALEGESDTELKAKLVTLHDQIVEFEQLFDLEDLTIDEKLYCEIELANFTKLAITIGSNLADRLSARMNRIHALDRMLEDDPSIEIEVILKEKSELLDQL